MNLNNKGLFQKLIVLTALSFLFLCSLSACGNNHPIVGTWEHTEFDPWHNGYATVRMEFRANGTMTLLHQWDSSEFRVDGRYEIRSDTITIIMVDGDRVTSRFSVSGDMLTIELDGFIQLTRVSGSTGNAVFVFVAIFVLLIFLFAWKKRKRTISTKTAFCSQCGKPVISDDAFCGGCGHVIAEKSII